MNKKKKAKRLGKAIKQRGKVRVKKAWRQIFVRAGIVDMKE